MTEPNAEPVADETLEAQEVRDPATDPYASAEPAESRPSIDDVLESDRAEADTPEDDEVDGTTLGSDLSRGPDDAVAAEQENRDQDES